VVYPEAFPDDQDTGVATGTELVLCHKCHEILLGTTVAATTPLLMTKRTYRNPSPLRSWQTFSKSFMPEFTFDFVTSEVTTEGIIRKNEQLSNISI
jgi:hypothetical protein